MSNKSVELFEQLQASGIPVVSSSGGTQETFRITQLEPGVEHTKEIQSQIAKIVAAFDWSEPVATPRKEILAKIDAMKPEERQAIIDAANKQTLIDYFDRAQRKETEISADVAEIAIPVDTPIKTK